MEHEFVRVVDGRRVRFIMMVDERARAVDLVDRLCQGMPGGVAVDRGDVVDKDNGALGTHPTKE